MFKLNHCVQIIYDLINKQEIVFKKDKATLHVISKRCTDRLNYFN